MTTSIAPAICCRTAFSGRWRFAIEKAVRQQIAGAIDVNLLPHRLFGQVEIRHRNHRLQTTEGIAWTVGVQGRQRTVMAGVHGLQHVDRLWTPDLADDDAIRPHAQRVDQELALRHLPLTLDVDAACLEAYHMRLPQL